MEIEKVLQPTYEQQQIIDAIQKGENIVVDAVPGSGKTSTVFFVCQENSMKKKKVLLLTYNKRLKQEVREKCWSQNVENLEIHSYHSLYYKYYDQESVNDDGMSKIINRDAPILDKQKGKIDLLVIDELQDMKSIYFKAVLKFIRDLQQDSVQVWLMGDSYQSVYEFLESDKRYLLLGGEIWAQNPKIKNEFKYYPLSVSQRLPLQVADWVNHFSGEPRIQSNKVNPGPGEQPYEVTTIRGNPFKDVTKVAKILNQLISSKKYDKEEILILSPSIRSNKSPVRLLENILVKEYEIPCFVPLDEDSDAQNEEACKGKVQFSTFCSAKGRERRLVVVFGLGWDYFLYFDKGEGIVPSQIPANMYVAVTRSSERMILVIDDRREIQSFSDADVINTNNAGKNMLSQNRLEEFSLTSPTQMIKYIGNFFMNRVSFLLKDVFEELIPQCHLLQIPSYVQAGGRLEPVSDLNGLTIPCIFQFYTTSENYMVKSLQSASKDQNFRSNHHFLVTKIERILQEYQQHNNQKVIPLDLHLQIANLYKASTDSLYQRAHFIQDFNWLKLSEVEKAIHYLSDFLDSSTIFEYEPEQLVYEWRGRKIVINSCLDAINRNNIWEFKCVDQITIEHQLQLLIYSWIMRQQSQNDYIYLLMNIKTGQIFNLDTSQGHIIDEIIDLIFQSHYSVNPKISDEQFLRACKEHQIQLLQNETTEDYSDQQFLEDLEYM